MSGGLCIPNTRQQESRLLLEISVRTETRHRGSQEAFVFGGPAGPIRNTLQAGEFRGSEGEPRSVRAQQMPPCITLSADYSGTPAGLFICLKAQMKCNDSIFIHRICECRQKGSNYSERSAAPRQQSRITKVSNWEEKSNQQPFVSCGRMGKTPRCDQQRLADYRSALARPSRLHVSFARSSKHTLAEVCIAL